MWCGKTRSASGKWRAQRQTLFTREEPEYTHGICPDCEKRMSEELQEHGTA
jgi:hypothetical protein